MPRYALEYMTSPSQNTPKTTTNQKIKQTRKKEKKEKENHSSFLLRRQDLTTHNRHLLHRSIRLPRLDAPHPLHDIHAVDHVPENSVSAVKMPRGRQSNEEL